MISRPAIITFVKNPILGTVKTRLAQGVGEEKALQIYLRLLDHTREQVLQVDATRYIYFSQFIAESDDWPSSHFEKGLQPEGGLGQRMQQAFEEVLIKHDQVIIIGSDCAELTSEMIQDAFDQLNRTDVVVGPALDGGYYLLGMKTIHPELFQDIKWSTDQVFPTTIERIQAKGLTYATLPALSDIDYVEDWERLGWEL